MTRPDAELLAAVHGGDQAAMDEILARYEPQIYRFGLRMCGNVEDARDVLQETLLSAFRNLDAFRGDAKLSTWLYQIARSFCIKRGRPHRDVAADASLDEDTASPPTSDRPGPEAQAYARQIGAALAAAVAALPEAQREALVLRDVEGLSAEEAALVAGVEVAALKSRLHRARLDVRAHLSTLLAEGAEAAPSPCPELAHELSGYVGADVDHATCTRIEAHIDGCARCAGACEDLKRSVSLCQRIPGDEVPAAVRAAVRRSLRAAIAPGPEAPR